MYLHTTVYYCNTYIDVYILFQIENREPRVEKPTMRSRN